MSTGTESLFSALDRDEGRIGASVAYWLALPLRCKFKHVPKVIHVWNENVPGIPEDEYRECVRCGHFMGYVG